MGIKEMQGVSAYLEYVGPRGRKRKKTCAYYFEGECHCKSSNYYLLRCGGRSFCKYFDDSEETREIYKDELEKNSFSKKKKNNASKYKKVTLLCLEDGKLKQIQIVSSTEVKLDYSTYSEQSDVAKQIITEGVGTILYMKVKIGDYIVKKKFKVIEIK